MFLTLLTTFASLIVSCQGAGVGDPEYGIHASSDGRHFTTMDGEPFFWQADTAWLLYHRLNMTELEVYLKDRQSKGFNMVLVTGVTQLG